jgi:hypothetical protein
VTLDVASNLGELLSNGSVNLAPIAVELGIVNQRFSSDEIETVHHTGVLLKVSVLGQIYVIMPF